MALMLVFNQLVGANGCQWIKTPRGWVLQEMNDEPHNGDNGRRLDIRPDLYQNNREISQVGTIWVIGMKGHRRLTVYLSQFMELFDIAGAALDIRRKAFLFKFMLKMMKTKILKVSGTSHQQLFKVLESMFNEALQSEYMIGQMKELLIQSLVTLRDKGTSMIGSKPVWNRNLQTVTNMCTKMEQFTYTERIDDGGITLTDLPKECLIDIFRRLSDHKDVLHLGQTCWYFNDLIQDPLVWESLTQYHFSEKQMTTFIVDTGDLGEYSAWQHLYKSCYKKYGFSGTHMYTDKPVICSACKTLHWMMLGHNCLSNKESRSDVYLEAMDPDELISLL